MQKMQIHDNFEKKSHLSEAHKMDGWDLMVEIWATGAAAVRFFIYPELEALSWWMNFAPLQRQIACV